MRRTLSSIITAGLISFTSGCHKPTDYPSVYRDLNGDGILDEVSLKWDGHWYKWKKGEHVEGVKLGQTEPYHVDYIFSVALGNGDGTFRERKEVLRDHNSGQISAIESFSIQDFDGDGKNDLIYNLTGNKRVFSKGNGDGTFTAPKTSL